MFGPQQMIQSPSSSFSLPIPHSRDVGVCVGGCYSFFSYNAIKWPAYADSEITTKMIVIVVINNKAWLQHIFNALICNVSKVRCKDNSYLSKVSWPLRCPSLVYTCKLLTFLCTRQDFSFAQWFEFQGPFANSKTWNQSSEVKKSSDQELQNPSGIDHNSVPLFCNFYSFVLLEEEQAPCS